MSPRPHVALLQEDNLVPVLNSIELEGVSTESWGDAAREALSEARKTLRGIKRLEILGMGGTVRDNQVTEYRTRVRLYFEIEPRR